jgi:hypothetical protein
MQELAPVHSIYGNATDSPASQDPAEALRGP